MRFTTIGVALLLVASLATTAWASCVAGLDDLTNVQMACCKAGHHNCPMHGSAKDCCSHEGQQSHQQVSVVAHVAASKVASPTLVTAILDAFRGPILEPAWVSASAHAVFNAPSPPPYLLESVLLI